MVRRPPVVYRRGVHEVGTYRGDVAGDLGLHRRRQGAREAGGGGGGQVGDNPARLGAGAAKVAELAGGGARRRLETLGALNSESGYHALAVASSAPSPSASSAAPVG